MIYNETMCVILNKSIMNKFLLLIFTALSCNLLNAQEAANNKIQAGLSFQAGINSIRPETKVIEKNGLGTNLGVGMNLNYGFTKSLGFSTGLIFNFETFKYKKGNTDLYYYYDDSEIRNKNGILDDNGIMNASTSTKLYSLTERTAKPLYLSIPTLLLFRTKFIGYYRYFGKFGVTNNFLLNYKYFDKGANIESLDPTDIAISFNNENMTAVRKDLSLYKGFVSISGGTEWNFTGTTSLVAELCYNYGFVNITRGDALTSDNDKNRTIVSEFDSNGTPIKFEKLPFKQNQIVLKVSILF